MASLLKSLKRSFSQKPSWDVNKEHPFRQCPGCEKYSRSDPTTCKWCTDLKWLHDCQKEYILHDINQDSFISEESLLNICDETVESCIRGDNNFEDVAFSTMLESVYYDPATSKHARDIKWSRLYDKTNTTEWTLFNSPSTLNIVKKNDENSWFLDALCCVAERPELLQSIFLTKEFCSQGAYALRFCKNGRWTSVMIDDYFPFDVNGVPLYTKASDNQLWVPLIEKAAAKICGCYEALTVGGTVCEGLSMLTGEPTESLLIKSVDTNELWKQLLDNFTNKFLMVATSTENKYGIMPNQNYSLLRVFKDNGLIELRRSCSYWAANETATNSTGKTGSSGNDHCLNLKFGDFFKCFSQLHVCRVRKDWNVFRYEGTFPKTSSVGDGDVPIRRLNIVTKTEVYFTIYQDSQKEKPLEKRSLYDMCIVIFAEGNGHDIASRVNFRSVVKYSPRITESSVSLTCELEPGPYLVTLISLNPIIKDYESTKYVLAIHSPTQLLPMRKLSVTKCGIGDALIRLTQLMGPIAVDLQTTVPAGVIVYVLEKNWHGIIVMIENGGTQWLEVDFDYGKSKNMFNTRQRSYTKDAIPPKHRRVVAILSSMDCGEFTVPSINRTISGKHVATRSPSDEMSIPRFGSRTAGLHFPRPLWLT